MPGGLRIELWSDLHPAQRGPRPGPIAGTIWIDGTLFTTALPENMRKLDPPPGQRPDTDQLLPAQAQFDRRRPYAFTPLTKQDSDGYQRLKGPAAAGHVRCVNRPQTLRLRHDRPTTNCTPGEPCACGKTVTISPDESPRERMPQPWGTTAWAAAYHRRSAIESANAEIKTHRLAMRRGFTRVFGTVRNTLLLVFAFAGVNVRLLRDWHATRELPDPWAIHLNEADLGDGPKRPANRKRRRTRTLADLHHDPPPEPDSMPGQQRTQ